jgi:hypothetical protein
VSEPKLEIVISRKRSNDKDKQEIVKSQQVVLAGLFTETGDINLMRVVSNSNGSVHKQKSVNIFAILLTF